MKYCPICEKKYGDEVEVCDVDGSTLRDASPAQDSLIGKIIKSRYRVIEKLGEGGMGTVYLAEQVSISRRVALKVLHAEFVRDPEFIRRFRQEARLAASLSHRNVVTVFDFDQADDGSLFIAMEYVQGKSLSAVIRDEGALHVARAVRLGIQIAEGLGAAHRAGVIHRDIKPDNIMVVGDRADEIKLMDFGIARLRDTGAGTRLTRSGMILGTPVYMAPEQIEGGEVTERTDIYAFGIVLYEMLSGNVPFSAPTPSAVLIKHLQEAPVPLRKLRKEIPTQIERVVMHALEKKPERRPAHMLDVVEELRKAEKALEVASKAFLATPRQTIEKGWGHLQSLRKFGALLPRLRRTEPNESLQPEQAPQTVSLDEKAALRIEEAAVREVEEAGKTVSQEQVPGTVLATRPLDVAAELPEKSKFQWKEIGIGVGVFVVILGATVGGLYLFLKSGGREERQISPQTETREAPPPAPSPTLASLTVQAEKTELELKERVPLSIEGRYSDGKTTTISEGVEWQSSDRSVAEVTRAGEAIGHKEGKARITANYGGLKAPTLTLVVKGRPPDPLPPAPIPRLASLTVQAEKTELKIKERVPLTVKGRYSDGKTTTISEGVEWQSSDRTVAEVTRAGEVIGHKEGKAEITARHAGVISSALTLSVKSSDEPSKPEETKTETIQDFRRRLLR
ncbi:MAG: protein kinase [Deltaproteobacteria bacterium]|nr:protein kinase [Deltaproteobacteria bacterium]